MDHHDKELSIGSDPEQSASPRPLLGEVERPHQQIEDAGVDFALRAIIRDRRYRAALLDNLSQTAVDDPEAGPQRRMPLHGRPERISQGLVIELPGYIERETFVIADTERREAVFDPKPFLLWTGGIDFGIAMQRSAAVDRHHALPCMTCQPKRMCLSGSTASRTAREWHKKVRAAAMSALISRSPVIAGETSRNAR